MKISCTTGGWRDVSLEEALALVRRAGLEAVELSWSHVQRDVGVENAAGTVQRLLDSNALALSGLTVDPLAAVDEEQLTAAVASIGTQLRDAKTWSAPGVNLVGHDRRRQSMETFTRGLGRVLAMAQELGVTVNVANAYSTRIEQIEDLRHVFAVVRHPCLRVLNDIGQFHAAAVNARDVLAEFGDRTACIRVSDRIGRRPVPIGNGEINLARIIADAKRAGYDGWFVIDLTATRADDGLPALADAIACLRHEHDGADERS